MARKRIGKTTRAATGTASAATLNPAVDRRGFLKLAGATAALAGMSLGSPVVKKAHAQQTVAYPGSELKRTVCTHCAVACGIVAEVQNGVWVRQEIAQDHPLSLGGHCCKGASVIDLVKSEKRLKSPMKKVNGKWQKISWDEAMSEVTQKLSDIREKDGPDAVMWIGSAKMSNEGAYLQRKLAAFWGTNNIDHQARICHSTTVAGLANMWGYGAMTNHMPDIQNSKAVFFIGSNAAEAHPISMQHVLIAKEKNDARIIVVDPRFTKTAAKATDYVRIRSGTDVPFMMGMINIIFENGWEDKKFLDTRVTGVKELRQEAANYPADLVEGITGVPAAELKRITKLMVDNKPGTIVWCMGGTQHTVGNSNTRAYCLLQLVLGNMGVPGGGANVFRGHDNVQGATDMCVLSDNLPGYYGLSEGAWRHWSRVWDVEYDYLLSRFRNKEYMSKPGFTLARWYYGALDEDKIDQYTPLKAVVYWGCASNSQSQFHKLKEAINNLDLAVIIDPYPTMTAAASDRDNVILLPASSQCEAAGSVTSSNRNIQWREKVVDPVHESRTDYDIAMEFSKRFGFYDRMFKNIKTIPEDVTREINKGTLTIGYNGQTPERLKTHMNNWHLFDVPSLKGKGGPVKGEYFGLPWPCWSTDHPGTPILYDMSKPVMEGGLPFRARYGTEYTYPDGRTENILAANGVDLPGSEAGGGYAEFTDVVEGFNWKTDLSQKTIKAALDRGMAPFGNARARCYVWNFPDPVPVHREPLHSPRPDLVAKYPTYEDQPAQFRVYTRFKSEQNAQPWHEDYPIILTSGRMVEYMGGGTDTRSNKYLVELEPDMYCEIHPNMAAEYGLRDGDMMWIDSPNGGKIKVKAAISTRVDDKTVFLPFHFAGFYQGESWANRYPEGTTPYGLGEPANMVTNYGYDIVTQMQETKTGLCRIRKA